MNSFVKKSRSVFLEAYFSNYSKSDLKNGFISKSNTILDFILNIPRSFFSDQCLLKKLKAGSDQGSYTNHQFANLLL